MNEKIALLVNSLSDSFADKPLKEGQVAHSISENAAIINESPSQGNILV